MDSNLVGQVVGSVSTTSDLFFTIYGAGLPVNATEGNISTWAVMPCSGTLKNFYISQDSISGTSITRTYTVRKNSVDTALSLTISGASQTFNSDTVDTVSFAAGDTVSIHTTASSTTPNAQNIRFSLAATCAANTSMLLGGSASLMGTSFPVYLTVQGGDIDKTGTPGNVESVMPTAGTIKNAYVRINGTLGTSKDLTFTLFKNGIATSLAVTINTNVGNGSDTNAGHAVTVAAGDRLYWKVTSVNTPVTKAAAISAEFDPTVNGESVHTYGNSISQTTSGTTYAPPTNNGGGAYVSSFVNNAVLTQTVTWKKLYIYEQTAITSGSYQYQTVSAGSTSGPTVTMSSGQTGNDTTSTLSTAGGGNIAISIIATSASASLVEWGIVSYIAPPAPAGGSTLLMMGIG
jgi:hypothetical protein